MYISDSIRKHEINIARFSHVPRERDKKRKGMCFLLLSQIKDFGIQLFAILIMLTFNRKNYLDTPV